VLAASLAIALLTTVAHAQADTRPAHPGDTVEKVPGVVNLNDATETQLELLPGIGPQKARAIVEHRRGHPFHRTDELMKVKGIGRKTFGRLRPYLTIVGPSTMASEVKMRR
jgi:competence ComEA-like helix-hairpin-helix protein